MRKGILTVCILWSFKCTCVATQKGLWCGSLKHLLVLYIVWVNSKGSSETSSEPPLFTYLISTLFSSVSSNIKKNFAASWAEHEKVMFRCFFFRNLRPTICLAYVFSSFFLWNDHVFCSKWPCCTMNIYILLGKRIVEKALGSMKQANHTWTSLIFKTRKANWNIVTVVYLSSE